MLKIGLTGGIGSGKTYVSNVFRGLGIPVFEADKKARELMENLPELKESIKGLFGDRAYTNGNLNRKYISSLVFNDSSLLDHLNAIVHPVVKDHFIKWSVKYQDDCPYVIEEAALLFESGSAKLMHYNIFVKASLPCRIRRVMERDHVSRDEVLARIKRQMNDNEKEKLSDFIIYNDNEQMIVRQIVDLHNTFLKPSCTIVRKR
ncbi:MAG: dephospho-CoA kinase [Bacteroidales bacterium]|nr:dephospho-CoA kinase [Bacteroidales bacterium]